MLVSFAGPAANFLLSIGFAVLLRLLIEFFPFGEWQGNTVWDFFFLMFQTGVVVNIGLGWGRSADPESLPAPRRQQDPLGRPAAEAGVPVHAA